MLVLIILVILIILIAAAAISAQRSLVHTDELCGNALSQIGVQQTSRWDALTALAKMTKDYSSHEYDTLMSVVEKRRAISPDSTPAEINAQETLMSQLTGRLVALAENYPDLKANTVYITTMNSVNDYENKVRISRMSYNDTVTRYNRLVRQLPSCIFAGIMGFSKREYLETDSSKAEMPNL